MLRAVVVRAFALDNAHVRLLGSHINPHCFGCKHGGVGLVGIYRFAAAECGYIVVPAHELIAVIGRGRERDGTTVGVAAATTNCTHVNLVGFGGYLEGIFAEYGFECRVALEYNLPRIADAVVGIDHRTRLAVEPFFEHIAVARFGLYLISGEIFVVAATRERTPILLVGREGDEELLFAEFGREGRILRGGNRACGRRSVAVGPAVELVAVFGGGAVVERIVVLHHSVDWCYAAPSVLPCGDLALHTILVRFEYRREGGVVAPHADGKRPRCFCNGVAAAIEPRHKVVAVVGGVANVGGGVVVVAATARGDAHEILFRHHIHTEFARLEVCLKVGVAHKYELTRVVAQTVTPLQKFVAVNGLGRQFHFVQMRLWRAALYLYRSFVRRNALGIDVPLMLFEVCRKYRVALELEVVYLVFRSIRLPIVEIVTVVGSGGNLHWIFVWQCGLGRRNCAIAIGVNRYAHLLMVEIGAICGIAYNGYRALIAALVVVPMVELVAIFWQRLYRDARAKLVNAAAFHFAHALIVRHERDGELILRKRRLDGHVFLELEVVGRRAVERVVSGFVHPADKHIACVWCSRECNTGAVIVFATAKFAVAEHLFGHCGVRLYLNGHLLLFEGGSECRIALYDYCALRTAHIVLPVREFVTIVGTCGNCNRLAIIDLNLNPTALVGGIVFFLHIAAEIAVGSLHCDCELPNLEYGVEREVFFDVECVILLFAYRIHPIGVVAPVREFVAVVRHRLYLHRVEIFVNASALGRSHCGVRRKFDIPICLVEYGGEGRVFFHNVGTRRAIRCVVAPAREYITSFCRGNDGGCCEVWVFTSAFDRAVGWLFPIDFHIELMFLEHGSNVARRFDAE